MPYRDKTGPTGAGSGSGRGMGPCASDDKTQASGFYGLGRGFCGRRFSRFFNIRRGWTRTEGKDVLKEEEEALKKELAQVREEIKSLDEKK